MRPYWLLLLSLTAFQGCGPHGNSEERFLIRNTTNSEIVWQTFNYGKQWANMTYPVGVTDDAGSGGQLGVDSVKFIKGNKVLTFINPKYDLAAYEATEDWNYFNFKNWVEESENVFVYTLEDKYF